MSYVTPAFDVTSATSGTFPPGFTASPGAIIVHNLSNNDLLITPPDASQAFIVDANSVRCKHYLGGNPATAWAWKQIGTGTVVQAYSTVAIAEALTAGTDFIPEEFIVSLTRTAMIGGSASNPLNIATASPITIQESGPLTVQTGASPLTITPSGTVTIQESGPLTIIATNPGGSANQARVVAVPIGVQQFWSGNWGPTVGTPTLDIIRPLVSAANIANNKVSVYFYAGQMSFVLTSGGAMEFKLSAQCEDVSFNKLGSPVELWHSICDYAASPLSQVISTFCPAQPLCFTISPLPANTHFVAFFLTAINGTFPGTLAGTIACDIDQGNAFPNPDIGNFGAYGGIAGTLF